MFTDLLRGHYDSCHRDFSSKLVNSLQSYINSVLDHEKKSLEFITELRRKLYCIHEYNSHVAKATHKYPWSRKLQLVLVKYVELEYEVLYSNNYPSRDLELKTEAKVSRFLQTILYPAVLTDVTVISKGTDEVLKGAVLQILKQVRSNYLIKNKLICNIAYKFLKKIHGTERKSHLRKLFSEFHKHSATSDYGSADDSDFLSSPEESFASTSECVEVPVTENGCAPIPTVEFTDNDDCYFVYLQRALPTKRKNDKEHKVVRKKSIRNVTDDNSCITICSDSEDGEEKKAEKASPVVTFEILDDDEDGETNYMMYLHKEVATNTRRKKKMKSIKEVIVCSDSEDDVKEEQDKSCEQEVQESENSVEFDIEEKIEIVESDVVESKLEEDSNLCGKEEILNSPSLETTMFSEFCMDPNANVLIDPNIIFESPEKHTSIEEISAALDSPRSSTSSCRLNESLLVELLTDDLESRKEFEELEYFLFNNGVEIQGSSLANISIDDDFVHPETFDADINRLESFLDDSQLINFCANSPR